MKTHPVTLTTASSDSSVIKSCALFTFRALRVVADYASQLPAVTTQAAHDIAEAWEESARPNAK